MSPQNPDHRTDKLPADKVRLQMFFIWCYLFVLYIFTFLFSSLKRNVGFPLAIDATWRVAYLIVPVLGAFAGYWFGTGDKPGEEVEVIDRQKRQIMLVLTGVLHGTVYLIIIIGVLLTDFRDQEEPVSYPQRVDLVLKFMLLIWSVSLLPVGWLLKGQKIPIPSVEADRGSSPPPPVCS